MTRAYYWTLDSGPIQIEMQKMHFDNLARKMRNVKSWSKKYKNWRTGNTSDQERRALNVENGVHRCPTTSSTNPIIKDLSSKYKKTQIQNITETNDVQPIQPQIQLSKTFLLITPPLRKNQIVVLKGCQQILAIFDIRYLDVGTSRALKIVESYTPGLENME